MTEAELQQQVQELEARNLTLHESLVKARGKIAELREPPNTTAYFESYAGDLMAYVRSSNGVMKVGIEQGIEQLRRGQRVLLNQSMVIIGVVDSLTEIGPKAIIKDLVGPDLLLVTLDDNQETVVIVPDELLDSVFKIGDHIQLSGPFVCKLLVKPDVQDLYLENVPDITYEKIGGLESQVEAIRDAVELPFLHADLFDYFKLRPPKGVLLYGPPGCGKTLIAKAVANSLASRVAKQTGRSDIKSYFFNIKGPELLNKWVGETERQIREIFERAREKASDGCPVIIFFDEMDSLFRTRGSGISMDVESTIVPQMLVEIDGLESLTNVIVIGASNREELIDPALKRPGRLDVKIKVDRPDEVGAQKILAIYLDPDLPYSDTEMADAGGRDNYLTHLIEETVKAMYETTHENRFIQVTYDDGDNEVLYFKDFNSGAMIEAIVSRAKKYAIKRVLAEGIKGLRLEDLLSAVRDEFRENEDLPNTAGESEWARISGIKGKRIVRVTNLISKSTMAPRPVETIEPGQYL